MEELIILIFQDTGYWAYAISILLNTVFSLVFLPSVVITMANIIVFGPIVGTILSFIGEVCAAIVTYYSYRYGWSKLDLNFKQINIWKVRLEGASNSKSMFIILLLRLIPFVPSSGVTALAVVTNISFIPYIIGTFIGKIPSLAIEGGFAYGATVILGIDIKLLIGIIVTIILGMLFYRSVKNTNSKN